MANTNKQFLGFLGKKIRSEREKLELSQEEFGKKSGFHRTYIGMIERGEKNITVGNMLKLSGALNMELKELIDF